MKTLLVTAVAILLSLEIFGQCNSFFPLKENIQYEYEMYDRKEKLSSRMTHSFKNVTGSGDHLKATIAQEIYDPKNDEKLVSSELEWECENGTLHFDLKSMTMNMDNAQQMNMGETGMNVEVTGDELDLPSNLSVGQTLKDVSYNIKMTMGTLSIMNRTYHVKDRKVETQESLTTPAGTFNCYKVTFTTTDEKGRGATKSAMWYAEDAGMVKSENYNDSGKLLNRQVLVKLVKN